MQLARFVGCLVVPCLLMALSCASLSATDPAESNDAGAPPGSTVGSVGTLCTTEIGQCGWTALECSSDPECAHWYACVLDCHPTHGLQGCFSGCTQGQTLPARATELQKCLASANGGTCGTPGPKDAQTTDAPGPDNELHDAAAASYSDCSSCVAGLCQKQLASCTTSADVPDCSDYKHTLADCAKSFTTQAAFEQCLLQADAELAAAHQDFASSGTMACAINQCSELCTPSEWNGCLQCTRTSCGDALDAWLHDAVAQALAWCRRGCEGEADCLASCKASYGEGAGVLSALIACQSQSCPGCKQ